MSSIARWDKQLKELGKKDKKPFIPEKNVLSACMAWLRQYGMRPIRNNTGRFTKTYENKKTGSKIDHHIVCGLEGSGDIVCCARTGVWLEIEAKSTTGKQRSEQLERQRHVEMLGGLYILARSLDDLIAHQNEILGMRAQW